MEWLEWAVTSPFICIGLGIVGYFCILCAREIKKEKHMTKTELHIEKHRVEAMHRENERVIAILKENVRQLMDERDEKNAIIKEKDEEIESLKRALENLKGAAEDCRKEADVLRERIWACKIYEQKRKQAGFEDTQEERLLRLEAIEEAKHGCF